MKCDRCGNEIVPQGISAGYGKNSKDEIFCYPCCGELDLQQLRETGELGGYFVERKNKEDPKKRDYFFTNWPGSMEFKLEFVSKGKHNWWKVYQWYGYFRFEENFYMVRHVSGGMTQCATARKIKNPWFWRYR